MQSGHRLAVEGERVQLGFDDRLVIDAADELPEVYLDNGGAYRAVFVHQPNFFAGSDSK